MLNEYQNTIVKINLPYFGSNYTIEFITKLALGGKVNEIKPRYKKGFAPKSRELEIFFSHYQTTMAKSFLDHIKRVFHPDYFKVTVEASNAFANELELYEHLLLTHDWQYNFSDDAGVWRSGENTLNKIRELYLILSKSFDGKAKADKLWEKYTRQTIN